MYRFLLFIFGWLIVIFPSNTFSQANKQVASTTYVHIFSSSNLMGYLEPCG